MILILGEKAENGTGMRRESTKFKFQKVKERESNWKKCPLFRLQQFQMAYVVIESSFVSSKTNIPSSWTALNGVSSTPFFSNSRFSKSSKINK